MRRVMTALVGALIAAIAFAGVASAIPEQGTPEFDAYMQALQRNGFNLNPDTLGASLIRHAKAACPVSSAMSCSPKESSAPAPSSG